MENLREKDKEDLILQVERLEQERAAWEKKEKALIGAVDEGRNDLWDLLTDEYNEKDLEKSQRPLPWCHFSPEEVWEFVRYGFSKSEPRIRKTADFLKEHFGIPENEEMELMKDIWRSANENGDLSKYDLPEMMKEKGKLAPSEEEIRTWDSFRVRINRSTHNYMFRGFTYNQAVAIMKKKSGNQDITSYVFDG